LLRCCGLEPRPRAPPTRCAAPHPRRANAAPFPAEAGTKAKKKAYKRKFWTCRRAKDTDQIQDELKALEGGSRSLVAYLDEDAAGGGAFMCVPCARAFVSLEVLQGHMKSKPHKRMAKIVAEPQYTQKEADAGAGRTS
jgi:bud site selection protein 20